MNRGRLFATIEHVERAHGRGLEPPPPRLPRTAPSAARPVLTATPSALATASARAKRVSKPTVVMPPARDPKGAVKLAAKALKATMTLDPAVVGQIELLPGAAAPLLIVDVDGRKVRVQLSAKGLRKALTVIAEHGADSVVVMVQGKLAEGDVLAGAGIVAQVKTPKAVQ